MTKIVKPDPDKYPSALRVWKFCMKYGYTTAVEDSIIRFVKHLEDKRLPERAERTQDVMTDYIEFINERET